ERAGFVVPEGNPEGPGRRLSEFTEVDFSRFRPGRRGRLVLRRGEELIGGPARADGRADVQEPEQCRTQVSHWSSSLMHSRDADHQRSVGGLGAPMKLPCVHGTGRNGWPLGTAGDYSLLSRDSSDSIAERWMGRGSMLVLSVQPC